MRKSGFTIVELLIVIVVIAILAAITIVSYSGITNSAKESTMKNDLSNAAKKLEISRINNSSYPTQVGVSASGDNEFQYTRIDHSKYCLTVTNPLVTTAFYTNEDGGIKEGACPQHGASSNEVGWKEVATGYRGTCALHNNGKAYCTGYSNYYVLGSNLTALNSKINSMKTFQWSFYAGTMNVLVSVDQSESGNFTHIYTTDNAYGARTAFCGLNATGQLFCWGTYGEKPILMNTGVLSGIEIDSVTIGQYNKICVTSKDGDLYCNHITPGDGSSTELSSFTQLSSGVLSGRDFVQTSIGYAPTYCALDSDGNVYCWQYATGNGLPNDFDYTATQVDTSNMGSGEHFVQIAAAQYTTCGLTNMQRLFCWGWGQEYGGILPSNYVSPTLVNSGDITGKDIAYVGGGNSSICVLDTDGHAYCWGGNYDGQIGDGTTTTRDVPTQVANNLTFSSIDGGTDTTCAVARSKQLYCWGRGDLGALGNGSFDELGWNGSPAAPDALTPSLVSDPIYIDWGP